MFGFANLVMADNQGQKNGEHTDYQSIFGHAQKQEAVSQHIRDEPQTPAPDYRLISQLLSGNPKEK